MDLGALADLLLAEDAPHGDLTTRLLGIGATPARMTFAPRVAGVLSGIDLAATLLERRGASVRSRASSGALVRPGDLVLVAEGPAGLLHETWKAAQTAVEALSGIATETAKLVAAAKSGNAACVVVTTRKTFPGARRLMIEAIRAGGAEPHRLGLSETLLVFPEHLVFLADPIGALMNLRAKAPEKKLIVEVTTIDAATRILAASPDILQCEKMPPDDVATLKRACLFQAPGTRLAAAGGVNAANAADYARAGADILVSSAPYWAKPLDIKVDLTPALYRKRCRV